MTATEPLDDPSSREPGCVFLLTDYGVSDELAGVLRATVARLAGRAPLIDLTHGVPHFDVRAGALALARSVPFLGAGVVVGVVDPGVAGDRRGIAIEVNSVIGPRHLVGPDNGLLIWASEHLDGIREAVRLPVAQGERRSTFDGRDVFAPAAASIWRGARVCDLGDAIDPAELVHLAPPRLSVGPGVVETEVTWIDGFGNVQLSATASDADEAALGDRVQIVGGDKSFAAHRVRSFAAVSPGEVGIIVDANGHLAVVGDRSSAALTLGLTETDPVTLLAAGETSDGC
jgi:S-adenosylmethionine hydrolase